MIWNKKVDKSKEVIKSEKKQIREEKNRLKKENLTIKQQINHMFYFEILGIILCLLVLFILSGGRNYIKLYSDLSKLINIYDTITSNYYGDLDKQAMIDNAIESMMNEVGDNYTTYTDQKETNDFLENINSTYEGIGCTVATKKTGEIFVVDIFKNSPAEQAGIQKNDIILKIDDKDFKDKTSEDMSNYIKNNTHSKIKITIKREEEEKEITIIRKKIEIPTVTGEVLTNNNVKIGYIKISIFSSITYNQFKKELTKLEKENIKGLIIDVRNNTGGYLSSITDISSLFLKKGQIIYQLESNNKLEKIKDKTSEKRTYPIAVLINVASASASEILASAIKESYDNGLVVGTNSYGKGTVQKTKKLSDGSMIKYTIQKWLTPSGEWLNEKGVTPTDFVEFKTASEMNTTDTTDRQLQKALELVGAKIK